MICAFGTIARICKTAIDDMKKRGIEVGSLPPHIVVALPGVRIAQVRRSVETNPLDRNERRQMIEDIRGVMEGTKPVHFYGRQGGIVPSPEEIVEHIESLLKK